MANKIHRLKTWPEYYQAVAIGKKTFQLRKNDRDYEVEDILILQEYDPETKCLSGRELMRIITYIMPGGKFGLDPDYVILAIG